MAQRIQRKRANGWRMPKGAVYVGRPSEWGNPFKLWHETQREMVVRMYRRMLMHKEKAKYRAKIRRELKGKTLACWCSLSKPCHADVLLEIANS